MLRGAHVAAATSLLVALCSCESDARIESLQLVALGTVVDISVARGPANWRDIEPELSQLLSDWGEPLYAYGNGELAQANSVWAGGGCLMPSPRLRQAIDDARAIEQRHPGLFSAGLAELGRLWQLDRLDAPNWRPPDAVSVTTHMHPPPRALNLAINDDLVCAETPVALDVGGFAKGRIIDALVTRLEARGIDNVIVNIGGDLKVRGQRDDAPWRVAIRNPRGGALARIFARPDEAIFTSGNYERFGHHEGKRYGHILDPLTGWPLGGISSVTVIGTDATATDAAATALYVAAARAQAAPNGLAGLAAVADARDFLIVDTIGGVWLSPSMAERTDFLSEPTTLNVAPFAKTN